MVTNPRRVSGAVIAEVGCEKDVNPIVVVGACRRPASLGKEPRPLHDGVAAGVGENLFFDAIAALAVRVDEAKGRHSGLDPTVR